MPLRPPAGFISANYDPLKNPDAPTGVSATGGDASASVSFTAPANVGGSAITAYYAVSNPGQITSSGTSSPVTVTGLSNGTSYTFTVWALNSFGPGPYSAASGSVTPAFQRGLFGGGDSSGGNRLNSINYISIGSTGNTTSFGNLTVPRYGLAACASSTRAVFGGGDDGTVFKNVIDYVTIASTGNATTFGTLTNNGRSDLGGASNETRGLFFAGYNAQTGPGFVNVIDYITIASTGNATDFGDTSATVSGLAACASSTRAVYAGGYQGSTPLTAIGYVTIASTGNATSFGSLATGVVFVSSCSNSTRGLFAGGWTSTGSSSATSLIQYITIASTGNSASFGNLTVARAQLAACSSPTRAVFVGGTDTGGSTVQTMDYITIASTGNAVNFGNLGTAAKYLAGTSNCHGGV
jgi:hypothetical protein